MFPTELNLRVPVKYSGLGPITLPDEIRLSNQQEVISGVGEAIKLAANSSTDKDGDTKLLASTGQMTPTPHHVFSIIGGRGTGKTSILQTIAGELRTDRKDILVTDLIEPDQLQDGYPMVPAVIKAIESSVKSEIANDAEKLEELFGLIRELPWLDDRPELLGILARDTVNFRDWNTRVFDLISAPATFPTLFKQWVIQVLKTTHKRALVVLIDDADISINKAEETLDIIRYFLSCPQIITVVGVDFDSLQRRVRNKRLSEVPDLSNLGDSSFNLFGLSLQEHNESEAQREMQYVQDFLCKVLPPAMRYYVSMPEPERRLSQKFHLPGANKQVSVLESIESVEAILEKKAASPSVAELLDLHPSLLAENLRKFSNQFILLRSICENEVEELRKQKDGRRTRKPLFIDYQEKAKGLEHTVNIRNPERFEIDNQNDYQHSVFHMQVFRALLSADLATSLEDAVRKTFKSDLRDCSTMHDFCRLVMASVHRVGTRTELHGGKNRYMVFGTRIEDSYSCSVIDYCADWCLQNGATFDDLGEMMGADLKNLLHLDVPIRSTTKNRFTISRLCDLTGTTVVEKSKRFGSQGNIDSVCLASERDFMLPIFLRGSNDLGTFSLRAQKSGMENDLEANMLSVLKEAEESKNTIAEKRSELRMVVCGLAYKGLSLLDAGCGILLSRKATPPNMVTFTWQKTGGWFLSRIDGVHESITAILDSRSIPIEHRMEFLSYLADLPYKLMLNISSTTSAAKMKMRRTVAAALDQATEAGLLTGRKKGELSLGSFKNDKATKIPLLFTDTTRRFRGLNFKRREAGLQALVAWIATEDFEADRSGEATTDCPASVREFVESLLKKK